MIPEGSRRGREDRSGRIVGRGVEENERDEVIPIARAVNLPEDLKGWKDRG